ncbi:MAG TPA: hypothetical protein VJT81_06520 [Burkholderiales bacterium]|nr:hypothetical protein [Burkholderiales bacterium]
MRAQPGRTYAHILNGRCHSKFTAAELPEWNNDMAPAVDITDLNPQPAVRDYYRNGAFIADPGPAPSEYHTLDPATLTWQPLDAPTVDSMKAAQAAREIDAKIQRTVFETLFVLVNDVRVLKGQAPITRVQLRDQMVAFFKTL